MSGYGARQPSPHVCSTLDCKASLLPSKAQFTKHGMKQLAMSATRIEPQHIPAFIEAGTAATVSGQYVRARESVELPAQAGRQIPQEEVGPHEQLLTLPVSRTCPLTKPGVCW